MNNEAFERLVSEEIKNRASRQQRDFLRLPENWNRWQDALFALIDNLDKQEQELSAAEAGDIERYEALGSDGVKLLSEAKSNYDIRRKKIVRFKFHVESRLDEVTRMIALGAEDIDEQTKLISFLRRSIQQHKALLAELDMEATPVDVALWDALDGKWSFDDLDLSLI